MASLPAPDVLKLERIAVCGMGLIGGSVARALRGAGYSGRLCGHDVDPAVLRRAMEERVIDCFCEDADTLFADNDLVVLCQPVGALVAYLSNQRDAISTGRAVGIDVGSVKAPVARVLAGTAAATRFVPCHPIAGRSVSGWEASHARLFQDRLCVLTPLVSAPSQAVALARSLWTTLGARVVQMGPEQHDRVYAALSHLPQVLSYAYLHSLASRDSAAGWLPYRGPGLESFARLGGSDPQLWCDIALHNASPLADEIERMCQALWHIRKLLLQRRSGDLQDAFALAYSFHRDGGLAVETLAGNA